MPKPLTLLNSIRTSTGLTSFKESRSKICFQMSLFIKNVLQKELNCVIHTAGVHRGGSTLSCSVSGSCSPVASVERPSDFC
jgi:hypothetical protein